MEGQKKRVAVLVGCNYPNTSNELHGCINDVLAMKETLVKRFGFDESSIEMLTDAPNSCKLPTGANIKQALAKMVDGAEAGDMLYFHYSGHGTRIPSKKHGHPFRHEEAIVPCDFNLITGLYSPLSYHTIEICTFHFTSHHSFLSQHLKVVVSKISYQNIITHCIV